MINEHDYQEAVKSMRGLRAGSRLLSPLRSRAGGRVILEEYPDILTTEAACEALRVSYNALLSTGKLKGYRNGRTWRIPKLAVTEYILENAKIDRERVTGHAPDYFFFCICERKSSNTTFWLRER